MIHRFFPLVMLLAAGAAAAESSGGFTGPDGVRAVTASEAKGLPDDARIQVTGYLVRSIGDEEYEFQDDTGALVVEIDEDEWGGAKVNPETRVELTGELDNDSNDVELDVEQVALAP